MEFAGGCVFATRLADAEHYGRFCLLAVAKLNAWLEMFWLLRAPPFFCWAIGDLDERMVELVAGISTERVTVQCRK